LSFQSVVSNKPRSADKDVVMASVAALVQDKPHSSDLNPELNHKGFALKVVDLSKSFKSGFLRKRIRGIDGVSFTVNRGEVFAILGHNGAGKTTTINCILDLVHADRGNVDIFDCDSKDPISRAKVGYLPERPYFFEHLTGQELLEFYGNLLDLSKNELTDRIDEVLDRIGMAEHRHRKLRKYSKGMLQRIGLAQAILGKPELLILDEPMSGLDPVGRKEVRELLLELKATGCTIILSSHIVPDVEMLADTVLVLKNGQVVKQEDLRKLSGDSTYAVKLNPGNASTAVLPAWARAQFTSEDLSVVSINAANVTRLQELLTVSHTHNIAIQSVETHRTVLEDLFMNANGQEVLS